MSTPGEYNQSRAVRALDASIAKKGKAAKPARIAVAVDDGAPLLEEVHAFVARFVAYPSEEAHIAHTLWIAHAHLMNAWDSTPRLSFLSPEPGSGKTRALEITETLVPRPVEAINATPAYLFRKISDPDGAPTILYDEIDTVFGPKAKDHEETRGILNAGHRRGAVAGRCVVRGKAIFTEELTAYCAVALAGLGNLPDSLLSRAIIVRMRRRAPGEVVEPYRHRDHSPEGNALRERLAAWAATIEGAAGGMRPEMPQGVTDRNADVWEALLAVADVAGGSWPKRARSAAAALVELAKVSTPSLGVRLLADLRTAFKDSDVLSTEAIIGYLTKLDESPWADLRGKPLDARRLANYLRPYGVSSKQVRVSPTVTLKGYTREALSDPWARYLGTPDAPIVSHVSDALAATPSPHGYVINGTKILPILREEEGHSAELFGSVGVAAIASETSGTTVTPCPRCAGEGCRWCKP
jgi:hypothetical protein